MSTKTPIFVAILLYIFFSQQLSRGIMAGAIK